jgi:hypothetical protein
MLMPTSCWNICNSTPTTKLKHIHIGATVDVFLMGHPDRMGSP